MKISLAFSTCPNDTFIFDALVNHKIDTQDIDFDVTLADIDVLNNNAARDQFQVTKISTFAYADDIWNNYKILNSGSALGVNNGPVLVASDYFPDSDIKNKSILIPGVKTTANLLLSFFYPDAINKTVSLFSDIESQVLNSKADCGLLIHEGRFTYQSRGLKKIVDFGEKWQQTLNMPIPLGFIVATRSLPDDIVAKIDNLIYKSICYSFEHSESPMPYIRQNAREMSDDVMRSHIKLYVNDFTRSLGVSGKNAITFMYKTAYEKLLIDKMPSDIFI